MMYGVTFDASDEVMGKDFLIPLGKERLKDKEQILPLLLMLKWLATPCKLPKFCRKSMASLLKLSILEH